MHAHRIGPTTDEEIRSLRVVWADPEWKFADMIESLRRPRSWIIRTARALALPPRPRQHEEPAEPKRARRLPGAPHSIRATTQEIVSWARLYAPAARTFHDVNVARMDAGMPLFVPVREKVA